MVNTSTVLGMFVSRPPLRVMTLCSDRIAANPDARRIIDAMNTPTPLANLITLGARDLPTMREFYRRLGWPQIIDDGEFVAFELRGIVLALFPLAKLARDGNTDPDTGTGGIRFT